MSLYATGIWYSTNLIGPHSLITLALIVAAYILLSDWSFLSYRVRYLTSLLFVTILVPFAIFQEIGEYRIVDVSFIFARLLCIAFSLSLSWHATHSTSKPIRIIGCAYALVTSTLIGMVVGIMAWDVLRWKHVSLHIWLGVLLPIAGAVGFAVLGLSIVLLGKKGQTELSSKASPPKPIARNRSLGKQVR